MDQIADEVDRHAAAGGLSLEQVDLVRVAVDQQVPRSNSPGHNSPAHRLTTVGPMPA
ncbi:hypothetical protein [Actinomadura meridiana]|uniref:hypothetical protein n=1 Tax=Actinomadura meridiana TaxID=559626 RepID=UPI0031E53738